ncbi:MAG TPA: hypothetical protein VN841_14840 [Bryobacteraceae bacterium]|nr:hypothetical protein [Bryobacteraceae bacterium]
MSTRDQLNQYLRGLEQRLRFLVVSRGVAIGLGVALGATLALVLITNAFAFSAASMVWARVTLFVALAVALGFALVIPLVQLNRRRAATRAEAACPEFQERLLTYVERADTNDPFLDLLAMDTLERAPQAPATRVIPPKSIFAFATSAGAAGAVLLWLILAGPGFLGYGSALLWAGPSKIGPSGGYYSITVEPGNKLIRRKSDQMVSATLSGFQAPLVKLMARYKSSSKWEEAPMAPRNGTAYEFLFAALPEPVEYYVEAAGVRSPTYKLDVIDLPSVTRIKVVYHFPAWLGIPNQTEDPGGDLRAVSGTVAELQVTTDRPLKNGIIELENGTKISLDGSGMALTAKVPIEKDGAYHFAAVESGESVRLTDDYFIEAKEDQAPSVKVTHPGADAKVSPIEEVTVQVDASDDFALQEMDLHYSVNGSPEKVVNLLQRKGVPSATGSTTLYLEDFKMQPGDVVALYATAKDARTTSKTDIMFVEAQPFEKNYTQSQQMGGGGGGGGGQQDQEEISRRQKEIIAATWNAIRGGPKDRSASPDNATFLSEVQQKLKEQAESLAQRATSRELAGANQEFQSFVKDMQAAAAEMGPASDKLKAIKWQDALGPEQRALQHLLRAEATFRDIQVAFGNQGGGGGGGGGSAGRDLASLFDLELDTEKNQYETGQQQSSSEQRQKDIDDALNRLDQLARRQEELAQQQKNSKQQTLEQRRQQELLRREAEELKKQMEQLSRQGQQGQQGQSGQPSNSQSSSSSSGQSGQQSNSQNNQKNNQNKQQQANNQQQLQRALDQLKQATDDMRASQQASQNGQQSAAGEADARRAAERLKEATDALNRMRRQDASSQLTDLQNKADSLAQQQHDFENRLKQAYPNGNNDPRNFKGSNPGGLSRQQADQMAQEKEKMGAELDQLERDLQKAARELSGAQPDASARLRQGLSEIQQNEAKLRMKYQADGIRQGLGSYMVPREAPITQTLDKVNDDIRQAQSAMKDGNAQQGAQGDLERQLARVERLRQQMERMSGQQGNRQGNQQGGQQQGNQQGGNQQGGQQQGNQQGGNQQGGNQQGGNQQGGNQQGGGNQNGGNQFGGNRNGGRVGTNNGYNYGFGGGNIDPRDSYGRYNPQGLYQNTEPLTGDPGQSIQDARRTLDEMRQYFRDNPDVATEIGDLERELQKINVGDIASPELQERIGRTILPQLETLEVQMRRELASEDSGQVRSAGAERAPAGFAESVAEYFRKLSKGK